MVVNETMETLSQFEIPTYLLGSECQVIEIVSVLSVKRTLWVERPFYERIHLHLFFFADVCDSFVNSISERDKSIAVFNQFAKWLLGFFGHAAMHESIARAGQCRDGQFMLHLIK